MEELIQQFINQRVWTVMGASLGPEKYGDKISRNFRTLRYDPKAGIVRGDKE